MSVKLFGTHKTISNNFIILSILIINILGLSCWMNYWLVFFFNFNRSQLAFSSFALKLMLLLMNIHLSIKDLAIEFQKSSYISSEPNEKLPLQTPYLKSILNKTNRNSKLNEFCYYKNGTFLFGSFVFFGFMLLICLQDQMTHFATQGVFSQRIDSATFLQI